jgi:DNA-binding transcriptional MerR regulator
MPREIDWETRIDAEEMYIVDGLTYEQVSEKTGVSVSQLQRWGAEGQWPDRRKEYRNALTDIRRQQVILRQKLIEKAINSLDPQAVYAVARLERAVTSSQKAEAEKPDYTDVKIEISSGEDAVAALKAAVETRLGAMVSKPGTIDLKAIKDIKEALELLEKMESEYAPEKQETTESKDLPADLLNRIKEQVYGLV